MKKTFMILLVILIAANLCLAVLLRLATPEHWPITAGTLKAKKVAIDGQPFIMIEGEPMNFLGQIQSISATLDFNNKRIVVHRCLVRKNPFTRITVNNQWPIFYPLESLAPGTYSVVYETPEGEMTAARFDVP